MKFIYETIIMNIEFEVNVKEWWGCKLYKSTYIIKLWYKFIIIKQMGFTNSDIFSYWINIHMEIKIEISNLSP